MYVVSLSPDSNGVCGVRCGHVFFAGACVAAAAAPAFRLPSAVEAAFRLPSAFLGIQKQKKGDCLFFPLADISGITNILPVFSPYWYPR
jgi:hypothetical protein